MSQDHPAAFGTRLAVRCIRLKEAYSTMRFRLSIVGELSVSVEAADDQEVSS
jgi:hypothetical protein